LEIAAVGRDDFVQGFKLVGIRKAISSTPDDIEKRIGTILDDPDVGILVLNTDDMRKLTNATRRRLETTARPVVIGVGATQDEDLRTKIKRAIGVDLLK
jgi:V/A-type H+-transporting ATPase subunit F